jgi:hypothetical protein
VYHLIPGCFFWVWGCAAIHHTYHAAATEVCDLNARRISTQHALLHLADVLIQIFTFIGEIPYFDFNLRDLALPPIDD